MGKPNLKHNGADYLATLDPEYILADYDSVMFIAGIDVPEEIPDDLHVLWAMSYRMHSGDIHRWMNFLADLVNYIREN